MENSNLAAFPRTAFDKDGNVTTFDSEFCGLTKREYFAAMSMQGIISRSGTTYPRNISKISVEMADALLAELSKGE